MDVICRCEGWHGQFDCEAFKNLPLVNAALVIISHCGSPAAQQTARALRDVFVNELATMGAIAQPPGCGPPASGGFYCNALLEPERRKLLVMVGDGAQPFNDAYELQPWRTDDPSFAVLPALPLAAKPTVGALLPPWVRPLNVVFWKTDPREVVAAALARSGITPEAPRIFISYRQTESAALAIQLFDALSHAGFDVFLDHFRIPPGIDFQARLRQELGDKSMVLLLESPTFNDSEWITYEVNTAKSCGLGMFALNLCNAPEAPGVDDGVRKWIAATDFVGGSYNVNATLSAPMLEEVVATVRTQHDRAIVRRRQILEEALEGALLQSGGHPPTRFGDGCLQVDCITDPTKHYVVALTPRPPDLPDFHIAYGRVQQPAVGVVVGLSHLMEPQRAKRFAWLSGVSKLKLRDEGQMLELARDLVGGAL